jgi:hypothetical protein
MGSVDIHPALFSPGTPPTSPYICKDMNPQGLFLGQFLEVSFQGAPGQP